MNKTIIFISFVVSVILVNMGMSTKAQVDNLRDEELQLQTNNFDMKQEFKIKESLTKRVPLSLSTEYSLLMNQIRLLESYSGINMNVQLDGIRDTQDVTSHFIDTEYKGVRGFKIKIVVDKFSKETDMAAVLDDIHLLEKNTDFMAMEIYKDNNDLIVKGEVYGV